MCGYEEAPRLSAVELEQRASAHRAQLEAEGLTLHPVVSRSRKLAQSFWGSAWMKHLAVRETGGLCLAPGRTLLRHGCVLDVQVTPGKVRALVSARELYEVELVVPPLEEEAVERLSVLCRGRIDSLLSLLEGRMAPALLEQLCDPDEGLLPDAADWRISCSCPDWSEPCSHAAAVMYALGVMLDDQPELLFVLRSMEPECLISSPESAEVFDGEALSAAFGIELDVE